MTNTNRMPFTVSTLGRPDLFLRAADWSSVYTNEVPAAWSFYWYGNFFNSLDSSGQPLADDYECYTNGGGLCDPNVISFTLWATNLYVHTNSVALAINLQAGIPYFVAVLLNDTNPADAVWQPYTGTNLTVPLGTTSAIHAVSVGLKGLPETGPFYFSATLYYLPGTTGWSPTYGGNTDILWNPQALTGDGFSACGRTGLASTSPAAAT